MLSKDGHKVIAADSGEKGIEKAKELCPILIFLDNRMGGISGIETLQHLRTASPDSLVILMTAYGTTQTAIEAMKHGAFDYVLKPFDSPSSKHLYKKLSKRVEIQQITKNLTNIYSTAQITLKELLAVERKCNKFLRKWDRSRRPKLRL